MTATPALADTFSGFAASVTGVRRTAVLLTALAA